jgi:hypothetical protein
MLLYSLFNKIMYFPIQNKKNDFTYLIHEVVIISTVVFCSFKLFNVFKDLLMLKDSLEL